jgi:hypothetical protein
LRSSAQVDRFGAEGNDKWSAPCCVVVEERRLASFLAEEEEVKTMAGENLREIACVAQQRVNDAVSHVVFDPLLELIWTASSTGSLHSYLCPSLEKYTVFGAHSTAVIGLLAAAEGIVSLSSGCVRMHTRGGLSILNFR